MGKSLHPLDVASLCASYLYALPGRTTHPSVVYFTALAHHLERRRPGQRARHIGYLSALRATGMDVRLGRFKAKTLTCPLCGRRFTRFEEKETDVALGVQLVESALLGAFDTLVPLSGDSDLVPALAAALPFGRAS